MSFRDIGIALILAISVNAERVTFTPDNLVWDAVNGVSTVKLQYDCFTDAYYLNGNTSTPFINGWESGIYNTRNAARNHDSSYWLAGADYSGNPSIFIWKFDFSSTGMGITGLSVRNDMLVNRDGNQDTSAEFYVSREGTNWTRYCYHATSSINQSVTDGGAYHDLSTYVAGASVYYIKAQLNHFWGKDTPQIFRANGSSHYDAFVNKVTLAPKTNAPVYDPAGPAISGDTWVTISSETAGAMIYYTTDGSIPKPNSTGHLSPATVVVSKDMTLKAIAVADGYLDSDVTSQTYSYPTLKPFGVTSHWSQYENFALYKAAGVEWLRIDLSWSEIEYNQGQITWHGLDLAIDEAERTGLKVLAVLGYTPAWAGSGSTHSHVCQEQYETAWQNYVSQTVSRYAEKVDAWEIWNEPDHYDLLQVGPGCYGVNHYPYSSLDTQRRMQYLHIIDITMPYMQQLNCPYLTTGGFAMGANYDTNFLNFLGTQTNFFSSFNVFNYHCYGYPNMDVLLDKTQTIQNFANQQNWSGEFWITEHGVDYELNPVDLFYWKGYLVRSYATALGKGVTKMFWYRDIGADPYLGLLDSYTHQPTVLYESYRQLTTHWQKLQSVDPLQKSNGFQWVTGNRSDGPPVTIIWPEQASSMNSIPVGYSVAYDLAGNQVGNKNLLANEPLFLYGIPGDANADGKVDVGDLGILAANYGMMSGARWDVGDFNGDGKVDVGDLGILAANYGTGTASGSSFDADYTKVFGTAAVEDDTIETSSDTLCSGLGLSLIAGLTVMGLMLVKLEE
jgi:hypothetical protein